MNVLKTIFHLTVFVIAVAIGTPLCAVFGALLGFFGVAYWFVEDMYGDMTHAIGKVWEQKEPSK